MSRSKKNSSSSAASAASAAAADVDDVGVDLDDAEGGGKGVSGFISKIYKMVSDPNTQDVVSWNERGDGFIVKNEFVFASQIMRTYFRHQNFSSFVRQLNFYGFHKRSSPSSLTSFYHPSFKKGHPELLSQIVRKSTETKDAGLREMVTNLTSEVAELRQQNEDLFKIQQRILYIFSRYMRATQSGQVGGGGAAGIGGSSGSSTHNDVVGKRIRSGGRDGNDPSKRQRLLLEAKPDSPGHVEHYHADNYSQSPRPNSAYFNRNNAPAAAAAAAASNASTPSDSSGVLDLNTEQYQQHHQQHQGSDGPNALYGQHALSDLNWSADPVAAIQDLITKMPGSAQSVLNSSTSMPMQMTRGSSGALNAAQGGQPYIVDSSYGFQGGEHLGGLPLLGGRVAGRGGREGAMSSRGGGGGGAGSNAGLLDLSSQLASSNPKQLLEMLDRMGADQAALASGGGGGGGGSSGSGDLSDMSRSARKQRDDALFASDNSSTISGVFEDVNEMTSAAQMRRGKGKRSSGSAAAANNNSSYTGAASSSASGASGSRRSGYTGAKLSPVEDTPVFPLKSEQSPALNSLPLPTSPISPFISDTGMDTFQQGQGQQQQQQMQQMQQMQPPPSLLQSPAQSVVGLQQSAGAYDPSGYPLHLLQSPVLGMPDLGREHSGQLGDVGMPAFQYPSPFHGAMTAPAHSAEPLLPLTPNHFSSAPPSPTPYRQ